MLNPMMLIRSVTLMAVMGLLAACSSAPTPPPQVQIPEFLIPAPHTYGKQLFSSHVLTAEWKVNATQRQRQQIPVNLQVTANSTFLDASTSWGTRLLTMTYRNGKLVTEMHAELNQNMPAPGNLLQDLSISLWPEQGLQEELALRNWRLVDTEGQRTIYDSEGEVLITVIYTDSVQPLNGFIQFEHHQQEFTLQIQTLKHSLR